MFESEIPNQACIPYIVSKMKNHSLNYTKKLYTEGCMVQFPDDEGTVYLKNKVVLKVKKNVAMDLWMVPTTTTNTET